MELWQSLLVAFGGNAALLLFLGFLGRSVMSALLTRDLEKFKADLQQAAVEHHVRFTKLHEKRAAVLADLYKLLVEAYWAVSEFTSLGQFGEVDRKQQYNAALNAVAAYFRYFDLHRVWLPEDICAPLEGFARELRTPVIHLGVYLSFGELVGDARKERDETWVKSWQKVETDVPKLREAIENSFRNLLDAPRALG